MAGRVGVTGHSIPGATGGIWGCAGPVLVDKNPEGESASDWPDDPWKTWPEFYSSCSLSGLPQSWRTANTRDQLFQSQLKKPEWTKYILGIVGAILCVYLKVFTLEKKPDKTGLIDMNPILSSISRKIFHSPYPQNTEQWPLGHCRTCLRTAAVHWNKGWKPNLSQ